MTTDEALKRITKDWLSIYEVHGFATDRDSEALAVLKSAVEERDALKAEVEKLKLLNQRLSLIREDLMADLAAARPLLEAVEKLEYLCGSFNTQALLDLGLAALAYRAKKEKADGRSLGVSVESGEEGKS